MTRPNSPLILQRFLPYRLSVLANRISRSLAQHYEDQFNITRAEWRIMAVLGEESDLSAAEVAERTAMDKVAVSRAITRMLTADLIQRDFSSEDKRRSVLALSDPGKEIYRRIVPIAERYENKILEQLDEEELKILRQILEKLDKVNIDV